MKAPTCDSQEIFRQVVLLLHKTNASKKPVRLLGISVSHLDASKRTQLPLFTDKQHILKQQSINQAIDTITTKFGYPAITRGTIISE
jgi:hypothetical protein